MDRAPTSVTITSPRARSIEEVGGGQSRTRGAELLKGPDSKLAEAGP